jgi:hypothetical protein
VLNPQFIARFGVEKAVFSMHFGAKNTPKIAQNDKSIYAGNVSRDLLTACPLRAGFYNGQNRTRDGGTRDRWL